MKCSSIFVVFVVLVMYVSCKDASANARTDTPNLAIEEKDSLRLHDTPVYLEKQSVLHRMTAKQELSTFAAMVEASDWKDTLRLKNKQWTVIAPANAVLQQMKLKDTMSTKEKNKLVASYIIDGTFSSIAITKAMRYRHGVYAIPNMSGGVFQFSRDHMKFMVRNDTLTFTLLLSDILAENGMLHILGAAPTI